MFYVCVCLSVCVDRDKHSLGMDRSSFSDYRGSDAPGETTLIPPEQAEYTQAELGSARAKGPVGMEYMLTEEEKRVFKECNKESFWYRSVPISMSSMALAQFLISRGILTSSTRFGSVPKVLFAGACGYFAGKLSYMKVCQEKFKSMENSPLGEALRQRERRQPPCPLGQSELSQNNARSESVFQSDTQRDTLQSIDYSQNTHSSHLPSNAKKNKYGDAWEE